MKRRQFLGRTLAATAVGQRLVSSQQRRRPNILVLVANGWRGQVLPSTDGLLEAPALRRLSREGLRFQRAYTTNPEAAPARASLLTGRYPHMSGVVGAGVRLPPAETTMAEELAGAGYDTGYIGYWGLDGSAESGFVPPGERRQGFEYWAASGRREADYDSVYYLDDLEPRRVEGFAPDTLTGLALEFIRATRSQPFLLVVGWGPPTGLEAAPADQAAKYSPQSIRLRFNVPAAGAGAAQRTWARYYAMCSAIDENIGRLLDALDKAGAADDTVVVFTSDRGEMLASHGLEGDGLAYEESVRIPLLLRYPRVLSGGGMPEMPVSIADIMPTLVSLAGLPIGREIQGRDLSGHLLSGKGQSSESAYCQGRLGTAEEWRMVIRGLDKVVVDRDLRITQLYNLGQDPYEMENLARAKQYRRKRDEMTAIVQDWMRRASDRILPSGLKLRD